MTGNPTRSVIVGDGFVAGDSLTFQKLVDATAKGPGRPITVKKLGTLEDLSAEVSRRLQAEPRNMYAWLPLMYWRGMLSSKGKLGPLMNAKFPAIHPMGVQEYAKKMTTSKTTSSAA